MGGVIPDGGECAVGVEAETEGKLGQSEIPPSLCRPLSEQADVPSGRSPCPPFPLCIPIGSATCPQNEQNPRGKINSS